MTIGRTTRLLLWIVSGLILAFIYIPIVLIFIYSFNSGTTPAWPPVGFTLHWWQEAIANTGLQQAFLGTLAALAVSRYSFIGRESISYVVILPIALPGIVTGMALSTTFAQIGFPLGFLAIVVGHATFCIVIVYNNAIARMRRIAGSFEEASADLGADSFTTFRRVTFPALRSAMLAGGLLAFALSFDEVIVTIFTAGGVKTLPIWIFQSFRLANQVPLVNVAGVVAILLSVIPVYLATRVSSGVAGARS